MTEENQRFLRLFIDVTNKCNLKCIMCAVPYYDDLRCDMSLGLFKKIALSTFPYIKELSLSCGYEPFIVKDFIEMLSYIRGSGIPLSALVTNGVLLNETNINRLIYAGIDCLFISIEGAQKITYEKIRKGADFETTLSKIELINRLKEEFSSPKPGVYFMTTLMHSNIAELPQLIMLAARLKVKGIALKPIYINTTEMISESLENDKDQATRYFIQSKKMAEEFNISLIITPDLQNLIGAKDAYADHGEEGIKKCREIQPVMYISSDGKVKPCPTWNGSPMGDFNVQDFRQIWEGDEFEKLRSEIADGNFGEICLRCRYLI